MESTEFIPELSPPIFSLLVLPAFTHPQLVAFCSRHGLRVPGFRLEKLEIAELLDMVYEECSLPGPIADSLQEELDRRYREQMEKLPGLSERKARKIFRDVGIDEADELIGYLWAAWRDPRPRINREADRFSGFLDELYFEGDPFAGEENSPARAGGEAEAGAQPGSPGGRRRRETARVENKGEEGEPGEKAAPAGTVSVLAGLYRLGEEWGEELKKVEKYLKKADAETEKARRGAEKRRKEVRERDDQVRLLREELKGLKKELQELKKVQARTPAAPLKEIEALKSRLHGLERELRKRDHEIGELNKLREKNLKVRRQVRVSEAELAAARGRIGRLEGEVREEKEEAAALREKIARLEKSRAAVFTRTRPPHDRERLGIYYDSRNIYYTARNTFQGGRVDIEELLTRIVQGRKLVRALAYVVQADFDNKEPYFDLLAHRGFQVKRRDLKVRHDGSMKGDWDMGIALDLIRHSGDLDTIALVSGDGDFRDLAVFLKGRGVRVEVYGVDSCTALDLKQAADLFVPIDREWLLDQPSA